MIDMTGVEGAITTPRPEIEYAGLHLCAAPGCEEKATWVIMEVTPRTRPVQLKRTAGSVSVYCHDHVGDAEPAPQALVEGHARTSEGLQVYKNLAAAWPGAVRMI